MTGDRLNWIFDAGRAGDDLAHRYDSWAEDYDADHRRWGWRGPWHVVDALARHRDPGAEGPILDAGCGTGAAGVEIRSSGVVATLIGVDLSVAMLEQARAVTTDRGGYDALVRCSIDRLPLADDSVAAVISSGVFTHGHVGPEALVELVRVTAPGGTVSITRRLDLAERYQPMADRLEREGRWRLVEVTEPESYHPGLDGTEDGQDLQSVLTWLVGRPDDRTPPVP